MQVIPAIDLKGGKCVRLLQGDLSKETCFSDNPEEMAVHWISKGAERIHVVDLEGAVAGRPLNLSSIKRILDVSQVPIQLGGGIRDIDTIEEMLEMGISQLILGTSALKDPDMVKKAIELFPHKIILSIDLRDGKVAIEGWTSSTDKDGVELINEFKGLSLFGVIVTDISRDGMQTGINMDFVSNIIENIDFPLYIAGGVASLEDIRALLPFKEKGLKGVITGRAIYSGSLDLEEAIKIAKY